MVKFMVQADPEKYRKHVRTANGKKVLYVHILKALYGCMRSGLLWYKLFSETLQGHGSELNPYDPCVANKIIDNKQCTITWYVDDLNISHEKCAVADDTIKIVESHFGKLTVTCGNKQSYVGMDIEFQLDGSVTLFQKDHLLEAIEAFGEDESTPVPSAA